MTGAMYAAIAGLQAHMQKLNVIGNNVANVNTYGYKAGSTVFAESMYSTVSAGSNSSPTSGGTNPAQIGYGCSVSTIDLDMSTKEYVPDGIGTHAMIAGDGFFMVGDKNGVTDPSALQLTRLGDFRFDDEGYLVDGRGNIVYGFLTATGEAGGHALNMNDLENYQYAYRGQNGNETVGVSTELVPIRLPLAAKAPNPDDADAVQEGTAIYPYVDGDGNTFDAITGDAGPANAEGIRVQLNSVSIDKNGMISGVNKVTGETVVVGYIAIAGVDNPSGVTHMGGPYYQALGGAGNVRVGSVNNVVQGYLNNQDPAAGDIPYLDMIQGTGGTELQTSGLESSGTDIATEFSEMITTQRGYQANTRIITVTDSMLEELVNMKR